MWEFATVEINQYVSDSAMLFTERLFVLPVYLRLTYIEKDL